MELDFYNRKRGLVQTHFWLGRCAGRHPGAAPNALRLCFMITSSSALPRCIGDLYPLGALATATCGPLAMPSMRQ